MSRRKSQLRGGIVVDDYFARDSARSPNVLALALAKSGKRYGYFVTDQQADAFVGELTYLLHNNYCSLNIASMQQLLEADSDSIIQPVQGALCSVWLEKFITDNTVETAALATASRTILLACSIFATEVLRKDHSAVTAITVECVNVWQAAEVLAASTDTPTIEAQATALGAYIMGLFYEASTVIARQVGPFQNFIAQKDAILTTIKTGRGTLTDLNASLVAEDFLSAIVAAWDNAIEGCRKFGTRNSEIILMSEQRMVHTDSQAEVNHNTQVSNISEQVAPSKAYTFTLRSGASVEVVVVQHDTGSLKQIICSADGLDLEYAVLLSAVTDSISAGLNAGVPLSTYVRLFASRHEFSPELEVTQLIHAIVRRIGLDFLDLESLHELGIQGSPTNQLGLLVEHINEPVLTDKPCSDCGAVVSQVGQYYLCMECGSAAV